MDDRRRSPREERELDIVPPNRLEEQPTSANSSPPTPPSPLPVSVGPGYQRYFFPSSPSISPPFSPSCSPRNPEFYETIPSPAHSVPSKPSKPAAPSSYSEYSPLLPQYSTPPDADDDFEWPRPRRRPTSWFRRWLEKICCCCPIPDCCPPLFMD